MSELYDQVGICLLDDSFTLYELHQCKLYYKGFLYSAGYRSGEETAR